MRTKMTIYELTEQWEQVMQIAADGGDPEAVENALADIGGEIEEKADGYAKVIKSLDALTKGIKDEETRLSNRRGAIESNIKRMKMSLEGAMRATGKERFKTELFSFGIQKNAPSVEIEDEERFKKAHDGAEYLKTEVKIDKAAIKKLLSEGKEVEGASLKASESLRIR